MITLEDFAQIGMLGSGVMHEEYRLNYGKAKEEWNPGDPTPGGIEFNSHMKKVYTAMILITLSQVAVYFLSKIL